MRPAAPVADAALKGQVVICPGGGYEWLSPREAQPVADAFAAQGWRPWVLRYTVAEPGRTPGAEPLRQLGRAVAQVRARRPDKPVVACGFSAGGHLAASLAVHWQDEALFPGAGRAVRPDAAVLGYPVVTAGRWAHEPSLEALLGRRPGDGAAGAFWERQREYFSLERQVGAGTPPVFLWHTAADETVPVQNSLLLAWALAERRIPFELHVYPRGVHGLSLATKEVEEPEKQRWAGPHVAEWFGDCIRWLALTVGGRESRG